MAMSRPNLELVETPRDRITIVADFPRLNPGVLFDYWTNPDQLRDGGLRPQNCNQC